MGVIVPLESIKKLEETNVEQKEECIKLEEVKKIEIAVPYYNYASLLEKLDRGDEAEEWYKKAIEVDGKYEYTYNKYTNYLKNVGRKEEAEKNYKKAIKISPRYVKAH